MLDVRPAAEFWPATLFGARSLPVAELRRQRRTLPQHIEVVTSGRGASRTAIRSGNGPGRPVAAGP